MQLFDLDASVDSLHIGDSVAQFPDQCRQVMQEISTEHIPEHCYLAQNVVVSGMGGSALGGRVIQSLERRVLKVPVVVSTEYHLPNFVNEKSLVIISSYSGNTEETISSLSEARARNAQIFIITTGGKLSRAMSEFKLPGFIINPVYNSSSQPRMGLGYTTLSILMLLSRCRLIHPASDLSSLPDYLSGQQSEMSRKWFEIAGFLSGKLPVLIASEHLKGAAHGFKNQLNENSKTFASLFDLPEADHHLLEGLSYPEDLISRLGFLFIYSSHYHGSVQSRYHLTGEAVDKHNIQFQTLDISGPSPLLETFNLLQSGGFISYYLALINRVDPGPVPWVDWFKDSLSKL